MKSACNTIQAGQGAAVFLHECGNHAGLAQMLGPVQYRRLIARAQQLVIEGDPVAERAELRIPADTPEELIGEELIGYLVEEVTARQNGGVTVAAALQAWFDDLLSAVRAWWVLSESGALLAQMGYSLDLTPADFAALAMIAIRWRSRYMH